MKRRKLSRLILFIPLNPQHITRPANLTKQIHSQFPALLLFPQLAQQYGY